LPPELIRIVDALLNQAVLTPHLAGRAHTASIRCSTTFLPSGRTGPIDRDQQERATSLGPVHGNLDGPERTTAAPSRTAGPTMSAARRHGAVCSILAQREQVLHLLWQLVPDVRDLTGGDHLRDDLEHPAHRRARRLGVQPQRARKLVPDRLI